MLRRAPKRYLHLLWAPALLRLLCPFSLESALSLLPANPTPIPDNIAQMETPRLDTGFVPLNEAVNAILPAARVGDSANPMQRLLAVAQLVWLAGAAGLLLYAALSTLRLRRQLKNAVCEGDNIYTVPGLATPFVMGILRRRSICRRISERRSGGISCCTSGPICGGGILLAARGFFCGLPALV